MQTGFVFIRGQYGYAWVKRHPGVSFVSFIPGILLTKSKGLARFSIEAQLWYDDNKNRASYVFEGKEAVSKAICSDTNAKAP